MKAKIFRRLIAPVMSLFALAACDHEFDDFHGLPDYSYFRTGFYESSFAADSSSSAKTEFEYRVWAEAATKMRRCFIVSAMIILRLNTECRFNPRFTTTEKRQDRWLICVLRRKLSTTVTS